LFHACGSVREVDLMARLLGKHLQKGSLDAAITIKERVDRVQLVDVFGGAGGELLGANTKPR
jgi:hypothetical protein